MPSDKSNSIKIHGGIFISLGCDIPNITDSYKYIECNGYREHYIANMDDSKHLLLKNIIEMETLIYKNNLDSNKSEDISELIHSYFLDLINYSNMIEKLDPDYKSIIDMIKKSTFDIIYHEHLSYFSLTPLKLLFERYGIKIFNFEKINFGASGPAIRLFLARSDSNYQIANKLKKQIKFEKKWGVE